MNDDNPRAYASITAFAVGSILRETNIRVLIRDDYRPPRSPNPPRPPMHLRPDKPKAERKRRTKEAQDG